MNKRNARKLEIVLNDWNSQHFFLTRLTFPFSHLVKSQISFIAKTFYLKLDSVLFLVADLDNKKGLFISGNHILSFDDLFHIHSRKTICNLYFYFSHSFDQTCHHAI